MSTTAADLLPTAKKAMEILAQAEAEKAREEARQKEKAEAEKKALLDGLANPPHVSEEEALERAAAII